ncbi:hypothetical protein BH09MYX1_BH09MYX1_30790 [soil metagenome]
MDALHAVNKGGGPKLEAIFAPRAKEIAKTLEPLLKDEEKAVAKQAALVWKRLGL